MRRAATLLVLVSLLFATAPIARALTFDEIVRAQTGISPIINFPGGQVLGAATPLLSYNATTTQAYLPVPPAPVLQAAPYVFYDNNPAFSSTRLLRVTDGNTAVTAADNSLQNRSFYTYAGNGNAFSADDAHFVAHMSGGAFYLFNFDPASFTASVAKDGNGNPIVLPFGNANFSYSDPDVIYGTDWSGFKLDQYTISTGQAKQLVDLTTAVQPPAGTYMGDMQVANGYLVADFGGPAQDQMPYVVVYNLATGNYLLLNLAASTIYNSATKATVPAQVNIGGTLYSYAGYGAGVHSIEVDHSGRYVLVTVHSSMPGNGFHVWDTQGNTIINALENAHDDLGYGYSGGGDGNYANSFILHKLDTVDLNAAVQLNPNANGWYFGSHFSWSNSSAAQPLAPLFDNTLVDDGNPPGQSPWQKEIIAVCTSCSAFTVWRFADNHMEYNTSDPRDDSFWDQSRGNVSQDGRYYLFDSNWDYGLGTDSSTSLPRHDLFIVDLASAQGGSGSSSSSSSPSPTACSVSGPGAGQMTGCLFNDSDGSFLTNQAGNAPSGPAASGNADSFTALPYTDISSGVDNLVNNYSIRWQGSFNFTGGSYTFTAGSDDGENVYVDGNKIINAWIGRPYTLNSATVNLTAGQHTVMYEYYQGPGGAAYSLSWIKLPTPSISLFTATPGTVAAGSSSVLSWTIASATAASIDNGIGAVTGGLVTTPALSTTTVFTLTAANVNGTTTATTTVIVMPPPASGSNGGLFGGGSGAGSPVSSGGSGSGSSGTSSGDSSTVSSGGSVSSSSGSSAATSAPAVTVPRSSSASGLNLPERLVNDQGTFYLIQNNIRHGITDPGMLKSYGLTFNEAQSASAADAALPQGNLLTPGDGSLVKSSQDPTVYLISNQTRYAFTSAAVFKALGFRFGSVLTVTNPELQSLPIATSLLNDGAAQHLPGADIVSNGTVYWIGYDDYLHPYPSPAIYNSWHIPNDFSTVIPANNTDLELPVGNPVEARQVN